MKTPPTARERRDRIVRWTRQRMKYWTAYYKAHGEDCQMMALAWALPVIYEELTTMKGSMAQ